MVAMRKLIAVIYGVVVYGFFGVTWAYFIGFLGGFAVPKGIDSGAVAPLPAALAIDVGFLALFFAHHSVMARARAKNAIARFVAPAVERSTYVLVSSLAMVVLMAMWRPMPQVVWQAGGAVRVVALVVFWTGVLVSLAGSHMIDGLAVFGVRQVLAYFRGRALPSFPFRTPGLYRLVRHPMMTGMLMTFWAAPTISFSGWRRCSSGPRARDALRAPHEHSDRYGTRQARTAKDQLVGCAPERPSAPPKNGRTAPTLTLPPGGGNLHSSLRGALLRRERG